GEQSYTSSHELSLRLRGDVRWHDGISVTTRDLLFSYDQLTRPGAPLPLAPSFWFVESLERVDDLRLRVVCRETPSMMLESWEKLPIFPAHLLDLPGGAERWERFFENPIGCGPYRLDRRRRDGGVELSRFDGYFRDPPLQPRLVYQRFDSLESKLLALQGEQIDLLVPDQRFIDWSARNPGTVQQLRCLPRFQHFVAWNLDLEPFHEVDLRRALAEAVDLDLVLEDTALEYQEPVESLFFPGLPFVQERLPLPLYDPKSAEKLLTEAGYPYDFERGLRLKSDGSPLEFKLLVNQSSRAHREFATRLVELWAAVGVTVRIELKPWDEIVEESLVNRDFEAVLLSWELPLERDRLSTWHSTGIDEGGGNLFGLRNQVVDELLSKLRFEAEPDELAKFASSLQREIAALQPCFFVAQTGRILWMRAGAVKSVRNPSAEDPVVAEPGIGKAGLERSRQWWVRTDLLTNRDKKPATDAP
ncbi:MAG: ABC transporter substrate-binding protein, partial [Verrucomicrobiota bacterium]